MFHMLTTTEVAFIKDVILDLNQSFSWGSLEPEERIPPASEDVLFALELLGKLQSFSTETVIEILQKNKEEKQ